MYSQVDKWTYLWTYLFINSHNKIVINISNIIGYWNIRVESELYSNYFVQPLYILRWPLFGVETFDRK